MNSHSQAPPTVGAALLLPSGPAGWQPGPLLLATPVLILRYRAGLSQLYAAGEEKPFLTREACPLTLLPDVLEGLRAHVPTAGPRAGKPAFPVAMIAASYEFGRAFPPHEGAFPHVSALNDDEFFASIFLDAYRPDRLGDTERVGYAGTIPAGWMPGAPELANRPWGHDAPPITPHPFDPQRDARPLACAISHEQYAAAVRRIHEYLAAGDTYQVNLTVRFAGSTKAGPEDIFDVALTRGGAAYAAMFITSTATLLSFSPELFLRRRSDQILTKPIKGTAAIPREEMDRESLGRIREGLCSSAKDRAEHVMIVDLERNDLGRICVPGSIVADPFLEAVEHPTVMHLESTVKGTLRENVSIRDLFEATFPGGSVTGAPKKRVLEIISSLESAPRGIYCGAIGWIDCDGDCELALPIRTAVVRPGGEVEYSAGGGIVADSDPAAEWQEIRTKIAFFEEVLREAEEVCRYDDLGH